MNAADVMTRAVVTIDQDSSLEDAVHLMLEKRISGLPIVDGNGKLVGMLTEGDLLRRGELGTDSNRPKWLEFLLSPGRLAEDYVETHSRKVGDVMTRVVLTVEETTSLDEVVALMEHERVKRLPVVRGHQVLGLVSRADLLKALARRLQEKSAEVAGPSLRDEVLSELRRHAWAPRAGITVVVEDGVVDLEGVIFDDREREAIRVAAENVPGVKAVRDHLIWVEPNTGMSLSPV